MRTWHDKETAEVLMTKERRFWYDCERKGEGKVIGDDRDDGSCE
jgi:hypothetical protein